MNVRREFLKKLSLALVAMPLARIFGSGSLGLNVAWAGADAPISETDPVANAIGYKHDPKNIDMAKYKNKYKKSQSCGNCQLFSCAAKKGWGKCQMLSNGLVAKKGWCGSWSQADTATLKKAVSC